MTKQKKSEITWQRVNNIRMMWIIFLGTIASMTIRLENSIQVYA